MSAKKIIGGLVFVGLAGAGLFALVKSRGQESKAAGESETTPTVVTVQTGALKEMTLHRYAQGYGSVEPAPATHDAPAADTVLSAPVAGIITKVHVFEGEHVQAGDLLMELNSGTMTFEYATQQVERQKTLYAQQNTSLKNLQDAELQLSLLRVVSPLSGTITHLNVRPGQAVDLTTVVAEVTDLGRLAIEAEIPAAEAGEVKPGEPVEILTEPGGATEISYVSPEVDRSNDTVMVRALLTASNGLRPGQFVRLQVVTLAHSNCLAAPTESLVTEGGASTLALVKGDEAVRTTVQTGLREGGWVEVTGPDLKAGDTVVTVGAYGLPEKTKIQVQNGSGDETPAKSSNTK